LEVEDINALHVLVLIDDQGPCPLIDPDGAKVQRFFDG